MTTDSLPSDVVEFLPECVDSIEQLVILLWLRRTPGRVVTAIDVGREPRTLESSARKRLIDLQARNLLRSADAARGAYRYEPLAPLREQTLTRLERAYADRRYAVIQVIFSKPIDNVVVFPRDGDDS